MAAPPIDVPCSVWCTEEEVRACCGGLDPLYDLTDAIAFASAILFRLSGRQFPGECERIIYPCLGGETACSASNMGGDWWWAFHPYPAWPSPNGTGTGFVNCGRCSDTCTLSCVQLPATVNEIIEIIIDGVVLDPSAYVIKAYREVCRVDGLEWPSTNDLSGAPGDPGVWTIEYNYGKPVPADGRMVAAIFACQIALNRCGGESCLPQRLKNITRQGVEMDFADPLEFLEKGQTGIYEVDLWLQSVNPTKLKRRSRLHRADRGPRNNTFTG